MNTNAFRRSLIGGLLTTFITRADLANLMLSDCLAAREAGDKWLPKLVFSSNGQGISLAGQHPAFARTMAQADVIHADGMPVVLASWAFGCPLPERIATTDFFHDAAAIAESSGLSFFVLGATEAQNSAVVEVMHRQYPRLRIAGRHHGYFSDCDSDVVCAKIRESRADVLWVALGKPRQEYWSVNNRTKLLGVGWIKTCGGLYAHLTGTVPRAPRWMQTLGLEWMYRASLEPHRLGWRYLRTNPYALYRLCRYTSCDRLLRAPAPNT